MTNYYVACDFGAESGRIMLGTLFKGELTISEVRRFANAPTREKNSLQWNMPRLYQETLEGLSEIGKYEEPVDSVSCTSWAADYLLFDADGSLIAPTFHHGDPRAEEGMKEVFSKIPWESIYDETGVQRTPASTLFQLGAEKSRRLRRARHLLPVADGFNYLLAGVPRVEMSLASTTQLYNPVTKTWSDRLLSALRLRPELFPPVVAAGTKLGALRPEIARGSGWEDTQVVTSCSHEIAALVAGLPMGLTRNCAYLRLGEQSIMGTELVGPIINDASRELNFNNETGYGGSVCFYKHLIGLWILEECRRFWKEKDRELDADVLMHLATSEAPFESLINPADPRFLEPGDMPLKVQAYCKQTNQPVPRKPGPIIRCVLESLALLYRKTLWEIEYLTGRQIAQLYILGGSANSLLTNFTANALQIPVVMVPDTATSIGNVVVQALALGHVKSLDQAREIVRNSFRMDTINPHATAWNATYDRFVNLCPA